MQEYQYEVCHLQAEANKMADTLSRAPSDYVIEDHYVGIIFPNVHNLQVENDNDPDLRPTKEEHQVQNEVIHGSRKYRCYKNKLWTHYGKETL